MSHRVPGGTLGDTGGQHSRNRLHVLSAIANSITAIKYDVTVKSFAVAGCSVPGSSVSSVSAQLFATLFNDGTSTGPDDGTGDVGAQLFVRRASNSTNPPRVLRVEARLGRCTTPTCNGFSTIGVLDFGTVSRNTRVTLRMEWDEATKAVHFQKDGEPIQSVTYTQDDSLASVLRIKALQVRGDIANCTALPRPVGQIAALFDNVSVNP